jgi:hypothetical protein
VYRRACASHSLTFRRLDIYAAIAIVVYRSSRKRDASSLVTAYLVVVLYLSPPPPVCSHRTLISQSALSRQFVLALATTGKRFPLALHLQAIGMSPSSTGDSPPSINGAVGGRQFPLPARDTFSIEVPSPAMTAVTNGANTLKSPTPLKSQRTPSFSREGILGSAQKARNLSQSSENRPGELPNGVIPKLPSDDDSVNPLKRRNTDAGVDYPRRRATIAVRIKKLPLT